MQSIYIHIFDIYKAYMYIYMIYNAAPNKLLLIRIATTTTAYPFLHCPIFLVISTSTSLSRGGGGGGDIFV